VLGGYGPLGPYPFIWLDSGEWSLFSFGTIPSLPMPRGKKKSGGRKNAQRPVVDVSGFFNRVGLPVPRLPFLIGSSTSLKSGLTIYPKMVKLDFPIEPQAITMAAGATASVTAINSGLAELAANFLALFTEYCLVGFRFELRTNAVVNPAGCTLFYIDETGAGAPTFAEASARPHLEVMHSATESPTRHMIEWKSRAIQDLEWSASSAAVFTPVWLKAFSAVATTFTVAGSTSTIVVTGALSFCFRGYAQ